MQWIVNKTKQNHSTKSLSGHYRMWTIIISVYCNVQLLDKFRYLVLQELSPYHSLSRLLQAPTPIRDAQVCSTGRVALLGECKSWHGWHAAAFWMRLSTFKISRTGTAHPSNRKSMISMSVFRAIAVLHINPGPQGHVAHLHKYLKWISSRQGRDKIWHCAIWDTTAANIDEYK